MKKKILALCLVIALAITAVTGATLAYFTDVDQNTNEFTVGSLKIDLWEDVKHTNGLDEVIFEKTAQGKGDDTNPNIKYENIMPGDTMKKVVTVENKDNYDAYIALVIKQENYYDFNSNVDNRYEDYDATNKPNGKTEAQREALGLPAKEKEAMQKITDDIFPKWNLLYDKTQVASPNHTLRYTMDELPTNLAENSKTQVLGVGYANKTAAKTETNTYKPVYNYSGAYFTNGGGFDKQQSGEPNFLTISDKTEKHDRVWIVYLMVPAKDSFTIDLTTVCPTYFDNDSVQAFANMVLDVKAFAIQAKGLQPKAAFAEALKPGFGF